MAPNLTNKSKRVSTARTLLAETHTHTKKKKKRAGGLTEPNTMTYYGQCSDKLWRESLETEPCRSDAMVCDARFTCHFSSRIRPAGAVGRPRGIGWRGRWEGR